MITADLDMVCRDLSSPSVILGDFKLHHPAWRATHSFWDSDMVKIYSKIFFWRGTELIIFCIINYKVINSNFYIDNVPRQKNILL